MDDVFGNSSWQTVIESFSEFNDCSKVSSADISDLQSECSFNVDAFKNHENSLDILNISQQLPIDQNDENHLIEKKIHDDDAVSDLKMNDSSFWILGEDKTEDVSFIEQLLSPHKKEMKCASDRRNLTPKDCESLEPHCAEVPPQRNPQIHLYQNIPYPKTILKSAEIVSKTTEITYSPTPTYVNIPASSHIYQQNIPGKLNSNKLNRSMNGNLSKQSSPYEKKIRKSGLSRNSPGYVQMSSPYIRSPMSSLHNKIASRLANFAGQVPQTIFCPLCPRQFSYERTLSSHIQKCHRIEMEAMIEGKLDTFNLQSCPVCPANFFNDSVLPKHLIDCHKDCLVSLLEKNKCVRVTSKSMQCPFCSKCLPVGINGEHMLLFHLHQYHSTLYEDMITRTFGNQENITNNNNGNVSKTPGLSGKMQSMLLAQDSKRKFDEVEREDHASLYPVRKSPRTSVNCLGPHKVQSKGILRSSTTPRLPRVKRELRFSVPHVTKEEIYFPESPEPRNTKATEFEFVNSLPAKDSEHSTSFTRKRRSLGLHVKTGKLFRFKDKENLDSKLEKIVQQPTYMTTNFRSFRKAPRQPDNSSGSSRKITGSPCANKLHSTCERILGNDGDLPEHKMNNTKSESLKDVTKVTDNSLASIELHSQLRLFRCNNCRNKFCDSGTLVTHVNQVHKGFLSLLRPQFGCGVCAAKFYECKHLTRHCLQNHFSLLDRKTSLGLLGTKPKLVTTL